MIQHKIDYSIALLQKTEKLALSFHPDGFRLAFSGGKDSIVLYRLAQMAGDN
jgi:phosphoadenosine phosphosulfate reductase